MELREALTQISEIRKQLARTEIFRGYRAATVAFSGIVAFAAAMLQTSLPSPLVDIHPYLVLWLSAAALSIVVVAVEMIVRGRRSRMQAQLSLLAVEQFVPSLVAGAMLTYVLIHFAGEVLWMLPGLWIVLFSLGTYASCRLLPRPIFWIACFYLLAGMFCLIFAKGAYAFSPWAMGVPFGMGQLISGGVLYWTLERRNG